MYVNTDIILVAGPSVVLKNLAAAPPSPQLVVGQRFDMKVSEDIVGNPGWRKKLIEARNNHEGQYHQSAGVDYFIYRKGTMGTLPPFTLARFRWDQWIVGHCLQRGFMVIDATQAIYAVHQNHDVPPLYGVREEQFRANVRLVEETDGRLCTIDDATHALSPEYGLYRRG